MDDFIEEALEDYEESRPWDDTQHSEEEEEENAQILTSYFQIVQHLDILQSPNTSYTTLKNALCVVYDHFNNIHADRSLYTTILERIGLDFEDQEDCFSISTRDGRFKGKDAIQFGLHNMAQVIAILHMCFLKCKDMEASVHNNLVFDSEELNVKLAELYYRQSAFTQRLMVEFDIVHPMASNSRVLLNKATKVYQEHAAFYKFIDGVSTIGAKNTKEMDTLFMIYFTIHQLNNRGYRVRDNLVYKEIKIPKRTPISQGTDEEGHPIYKCCYEDDLGNVCNVTRTKHTHPIKHTWTPSFEVSKTEKWNTHYWKPLSHKDFKYMDSPTIENFIYRVAEDNGKAHRIVQANSSIAKEVEKYIVRSCTSMVRFLETKERTYACWNGILISSKFYPYDELPKEYENMCVDKYFPKWYFYEEDERAMRGKPCAAILPTDYFKEYPRPVECCYDGYVQNMYCKMCRLPHDTVDHSKCGYHSKNSSSSSSATPAKWCIRCTKCKKIPRKCTCPSKKPSLYRLHAWRYLYIPTVHWDQLVMTQIKGMTIASPTEKGSRILLPETEYLNTYRWDTGMSFRPNFRIGPHARKFKKKKAQDQNVEEDENEDDNERSIYADCWRVARVIQGATGTGKSASIDMVKIYLPEFGNLSDKNQDKFMLQQCVKNGKFKPILMGEMGTNKLGRTIFCALVDATTTVPVNRKGLTDVNAVCDRGLTLLTNEFQLAGGDVEGSVQSRLAMLRYEVAIAPGKVDGMIHSRNANDPIPLVRKGNWAYEDISSTYGNEHFTKVCPMIYIENRSRYEENANPLRKFLNEPISEKLGPLVIDPDVYMKRKDLIDAFKDHCKLNGIKPTPWTDDHYDLRKSKIKPVPIGKICDDQGVPIMEKFVYGIAPINDATAAKIIRSKKPKPVDVESDEEEVDDGKGFSTFQITDNALTASSELVRYLELLVHRQDVDTEFVHTLGPRLKNVQDHFEEIEEMVELENVALQ